MQGGGGGGASSAALLSPPPVTLGWEERKACASGPALPSTLLPSWPGPPSGWGPVCGSRSWASLGNRLLSAPSCSVQRSPCQPFPTWCPARSPGTHEHQPPGPEQPQGAQPPSQERWPASSSDEETEVRKEVWEALAGSVSPQRQRQRLWAPGGQSQQPPSSARLSEPHVRDGSGANIWGRGGGWGGVFIKMQ